MCLCARMRALEWKERAFFRKSELHMFLFISGGHICVPKLYTNLASIMVREMFRQITQKLGATKTWDLDKLFIYQSLVTFHCLGFFHWTVSNLFFVPCLLRDSENDLLTVFISDVENSGGTPLRMPYRYWSEIVSGFGVPEGTSPSRLICEIGIKFSWSGKFYICQEKVRECQKPLAVPTMTLVTPTMLSNGCQQVWARLSNFILTSVSFPFHIAHPCL